MLGRLASSPARAAAAPPRLLLIARPAASPASRGSLASSSRRLSAAQIVSTRAFSASAARQGILKRGEDGSPPLWRRHPYVFACGATPVVLALSLGVITLALLGYDASTYRERDVKNVPVSPLALKPERGGPKNLKVASMLIDDHEEGKDATKQKLVIVGGGWGAVGILKHLDPDAWHVTVVAPDNYFLFQPLLPSATVGTVELRSLVEPLRKIVARTRGHFLQAKCVQVVGHPYMSELALTFESECHRAIDVDMAERLVEVSDPQGGENFYVPYDKLVVACGSVNSSHGVPGVAEHCFQLKTVPDAQAIRRAIMNNLEEAALPTVSEEERKRLLTFVVSGGGPTGVEFASELYDMVNEDVMEYLPKVLRQEVDVKIIQSRDHILNTYSEQISQFAEKRFKRNEIDMILNARVKEVTPETVVYTQRDPATGNVTEHTIPSGFTLWSTGIGMNPFTVQVARRLPNQYHKRALEVDSHLRVLGAPLGTVYALGDCATIETRLMDHFFELVQKCDKDQNGLISADEFQHMIKVRLCFCSQNLHGQNADFWRPMASRSFTASSQRRVAT